MYKYPIGFNANTGNNEEEPTAAEVSDNDVSPKKSLVDIYFPQRNMTLSYYNDLFDLHKGDIVYVDGKLEGLQGRVVKVSYSFKIKLADYKRVIAVADTKVKGDFYFAGSHIITFDPQCIPYEKALLWFKPPCPDDEYVIGDDDGDSFPLDTLEFDIDAQTAKRGDEYYRDNSVVYICVDRTHGRAIVTGSKVYEIEFDLIDGNIHNLVCSCYCNYHCKHEFAALLQLRETLKFITENYQSEYKDYFAAMFKGEFFKCTIDHTETGKITL